MIPVIPVPIISRKIMISKFLNAGAISKETAVNPEKIEVRQAFMFARLESKGILVKADNDTYYVNAAKIGL